MLAYLAMPALLMTLAAAGSIVFPGQSGYTSQYRGTSPPTPRQMVVSSRSGQAAAAVIVFPGPTTNYVRRSTTTTRAPSTTPGGTDSPPCPDEAPEGANEDTLIIKNCFTIEDDDDDFINVYSALDQQCKMGFVRMKDTRCLRAIPKPKLRSQPPKPKSKPTKGWNRRN